MENRSIPPGKLPQAIPPRHNSHLGQLPPRQLPHGQLPPGQFPTRKTGP